MPRALHLSPGRITVLVTVFAVVAGIAATGGGMFSPGKLSAQQKGRAQIGGVSSHAEIGGKCSACHVPPWSRETMADRCMGCHTDVRGQLDGHQPLHGKLANGTQCRACHTEHKGDHAALTDLAAFDHNSAAFSLTGKHASVACNACHTTGAHKGTPAVCRGCHAEPKSHIGQFGTDCAKCHISTHWHTVTFAAPAAGGSGPTFDHSKTAFPLTGHHTGVDCRKCHVNDKFKGTPTSCVACHAEPKVHLGKFGTDCTKCHTTTTFKVASIPGGGPGAGFDHDKTAFKLTGKHKTVDCAKCHLDNKFKGTSTACVSCHAEPKVHMGKFAKDCSKCHTTLAWTGATLGDYKHTFPIAHGRKNRGPSACNVCHKGDDAHKTYTCYGCHEHNPANIARRHKNVANLDNCVKCHRGGRGRERAGLMEAAEEAVCLACEMEPGACPVTDEPALCPRGEWSASLGGGGRPSFTIVRAPKEDVVIPTTTTRHEKVLGREFGPMAAVRTADVLGLDSMDAALWLNRPPLQFSRR
jgi:hypothetical protein